jgi:hypothetical protein
MPWTLARLHSLQHECVAIRGGNRMVDSNGLDIHTILSMGSYEYTDTSLYTSKALHHRPKLHYDCFA